MKTSKNNRDKKITKPKLVKIVKKQNFKIRNKPKYSSQYILTLKIISVFILHTLVIYYYIYNKNSFIISITLI